MRSKYLITCFMPYSQVFATAFLMVALFFSSVAESKSTQFVVPKEVELGMTSSINNGKRVAVLNFSAFAAASTADGRASELKLKTKYKDNKLFIEILGYDFTPSDIPPNWGRAAMALVTQSQLIIAEDWLTQPKHKEIVVVVGTKEFRFSLSYSSYQVTLARLQAGSAIKLNPNKLDAPSDAISVILWPVDVAVLYISGRFGSDFDTDIRQDLRMFAKAHGYSPADEVYFGLPQPEKQRFYVVVKDPLPIPADSSIKLGTLPSYPNIEVNIGHVLEIE